MNLGGVVSPRTKQSSQQASASPAPAPTVPQPSPNTTSVQQSANQQQSNLIATQITAQSAPQQQQQQQQTNIQQIPSSSTQNMKEQPQQPMVSFAILKQWILNWIQCCIMSLMGIPTPFSFKTIPATLSCVPSLYIYIHLIQLSSTLSSVDMNLNNWIFFASHWAINLLPIHIMAAAVMLYIYAWEKNSFKRQQKKTFILKKKMKNSQVSSSSSSKKNGCWWCFLRKRGKLI